MPADCSDDVSTHDRVKFRVAWRSEEKGVAANTRYTRGVAFEFPKKKRKHATRASKVRRVRVHARVTTTRTCTRHSHFSLVPY